jgi:hypothetical protein
LLKLRNELLEPEAPEPETVLVQTLESRGVRRQRWG